MHNFANLQRKGLDDDVEPQKYKDPTYKLPQSNLSLTTHERWTKSVIAPYVTMTRTSKGTKATLRRDTTYYNFYLTKKSSALMRSLKCYLNNRQDLPALLYESADIIKGLTNSLGMRLYFVDRDKDQLYQHQRNVTYSRCRVNYDLAYCQSIACYVAKTQEFVMVDDVTKDSRFPQGVSYKENVKPALCVPIVAHPHTYAVIELYRDASSPPYQKNDLKLAVLVCGWVGLTITENLEGLHLHRQQVVNSDLLHLTLAYFGQKLPLENYLAEILNYAKNGLDAEKGTFYVIHDPESMIADVYEESLSDNNNSLIKKKLSVKFGHERTVASFVAERLELLNVKDLVNDPRFKSQVKLDNEQMVIERTEICSPILSEGTLLGIISIINKTEDKYFTYEDETTMELISTYAGMALSYAKLAHKLEESQLKVKVNKELLHYHLKPCVGHLEKFKEEMLDFSPSKNIKSFSWYILPEDIKLIRHNAIYCIVDIIGSEYINFDDLYSFVMTTEYCYRNNPYHNFEHGFNVAHCMYTILLRNQEKFSLLEREALMIAALVHDIDHGGVTNNFLVLTNHYLAQLYEDSMWENHHYFVTCQLLRKFFLFNNLTQENYPDFMKLIRENILATDLVMMFRTRNKLMPLIKNRTFSFENYNHRLLVRNIMMTVCDLSGQCKPFSISKRLTDKLYMEFYSQGDTEKTMGLSPLTMLNRDNEVNIPDDQAQFVSIVVMPAADLLRAVLPNTEELYINAEQLRDTWRRIIESRGEKLWRQCDSLKL